jgi:hypothetical protein
MDIKSLVAKISSLCIKLTEKKLTGLTTTS